MHNIKFGEGRMLITIRLGKLGVKKVGQKKNEMIGEYIGNIKGEREEDGGQGSFSK